MDFVKLLNTDEYHFIFVESAAEPGYGEIVSEHEEVVPESYPARRRGCRTSFNMEN